MDGILPSALTRYRDASLGRRFSVQNKARKIIIKLTKKNICLNPAKAQQLHSKLPEISLNSSKSIHFHIRSNTLLNSKEISYLNKRIMPPPQNARSWSSSIQRTEEKLKIGVNSLLKTTDDHKTVRLLRSKKAISYNSNRVKYNCHRVSLFQRQTPFIKYICKSVFDNVLISQKLGHSYVC